MKATALAVLLLATVSCSLIAEEGEEQQASLELIVPLRSSLGDPAGMAGIRVEVTGAGPTRLYRAADFMGPKLQPFPVPDSGRITVAVQVEQDGETVAQRSASWNLRTGARWWMEIERGYRARLGHTDRDECNEKRVSREQTPSVHQLVLPRHLALRGSRRCCPGGACIPLDDAVPDATGRVRGHLPLVRDLNAI